jgi:hypothetical protein
MADGEPRFTFENVRVGKSNQLVVSDQLGGSDACIAAIYATTIYALDTASPGYFPNLRAAFSALVRLTANGEILPSTTVSRLKDITAAGVTLLTNKDDFIFIFGEEMAQSIDHLCPVTTSSPYSGNTTFHAALNNVIKRQLRITREKDVGHVQRPLENYLKSIGIKRPVSRAQAAKIEAMVKVELLGPSAAAQIAPLVAAPPTEPARSEGLSFAAVLGSVKLKERRAALDKHYAARKKNTWAKARSERPTPEEMLVWLNSTFPDRREIGMLLSDLKHLDKAAYQKVAEWSCEGSQIPRAAIDAFYLPTKIVKYDPVRDANAPKTFGEVVARVERGEGSFKELHGSYARARHHTPG